MAFDAVLVDLDGTIWDSFPWYAKVLAKMSGQDEGELLGQLRAGGNLIRMIEQFDVTRNQFFSECKRRARELNFFGDAYETLDGLRREGVPLGVVTDLPRALARPVCDAKGVTPLLSVFEAYKFGRPSKPNPQAILDGLAGIGAAPSPAVCYVGDLAKDAIAAQRADISFVWARYGYGELTDEPRLAEIDKFSELVDL